MPKPFAPMTVWTWPEIVPGLTTGSSRERMMGWEHGTLKNAEEKGAVKREKRMKARKNADIRSLECIVRK